MTELINLFNKLVDHYGYEAALSIAILIGILYGGYLLLKTYSSTIKKYLELKLDEGSKKHADGAVYRKNISPKVRAEILELAEEIRADRVLVFEFSNGTSNLVGLPFLYVSATYEVTTPGTAPVALQYQKVNAAIIAEFLEKLEEKGYYYVKDIEDSKEEFPILYSFMHPNNAHSVLFYTLYGVNNTIGFVVATTVNKKTFTREDSLPKIAGSAQIISSLLNFDTLHEKL